MLAPMERSNSPEIIKRDAAMAKMPTKAASSTQAWMPTGLTHIASKVPEAEVMIMKVTMMMTRVTMIMTRVTMMITRVTRMMRMRRGRRRRIMR